MVSCTLSRTQTVLGHLPGSSQLQKAGSILNALQRKIVGGGSRPLAVTRICILSLVTPSAYSVLHLPAECAWASPSTSWVVEGCTPVSRIGPGPVST